MAFCGTEKGMENTLVPKAGYAFSVVRIRGFSRQLGLSTLRTLGSIPVAGVDAWRLLRAFRPACVVGVGAYASGPVVAEAALRGGKEEVEVLGWPDILRFPRDDSRSGIRSIDGDRMRR